MTEIIKLHGDLTVACVAELHEKFQAALANNEDVHIQIDAAEKVDIAFLQLLCATHRSATEQCKILSLKGQGSVQLCESMMRLGFVRHIGCGRDRYDSCLWIESGQSL